MLAGKTTAREQVKQGTYLASLSERVARGYFTGLIGSTLHDSQDALFLLRKAIDLAPDDPTTLSNLALLYSTDRELALEYSDVAIMYAHRAVAADLTMANRMGVLACAYAAGGEWEIAAGILSGSEDELQIVSPGAFTDDMKRIKKKQLCKE